MSKDGSYDYPLKIYKDDDAVLTSPDYFVEKAVEIKEKYIISNLSHGWDKEKEQGSRDSVVELSYFRKIRRHHDETREKALYFDFILIPYEK